MKSVYYLDIKIIVHRTLFCHYRKSSRSFSLKTRRLVRERDSFPQHLPFKVYGSYLMAESFCKALRAAKLKLAGNVLNWP